MISVAKEWNPKQALLRKLLAKPEKFDEAIRLCLRMHSLVHNSRVSGCSYPTYEEKLWDGLNDEMFKAALANKRTTIAWNLWHITRIEDVAANMLIADDIQILDNEWLCRLNATIRDTGNAMTAEAIAEFSNNLVMKEMRNYRIAVGKKTRKTIGHLEVNDLKTKVKSSQLERVIDEGGLLDIPGSRWLADFWGRKTLAGILLMPITRHQIVHLNAAFKIKEKCLEKG